MPESFKLKAINSSAKALVGRQKGHPESCDVFLNPSGTSLGRGVSESDFRIPADLVSYSTRHCSIKRDSEGNWVLTDTSTNGTFTKEGERELWARIGKGKSKIITEGTIIRLSQAIKNQATQHIPLEYRFESVELIPSQNIPSAENAMEAVATTTSTATPEKRKHGEQQPGVDDQYAQGEDVMPSSGKAKRGRMEVHNHDAMSQQQQQQQQEGMAPVAEEQQQQQQPQEEQGEEEQNIEEEEEAEEEMNEDEDDSKADSMMRARDKGYRLPVLLNEERQKVNTLEARITLLQESHANELSSLQQTYMAEMDTLKQSHANELSGLQQTYMAEVDDLKKLHADELLSMKQQHETVVAELEVKVRDTMEAWQAERIDTEATIEKLKEQLAETTGIKNQLELKVEKQEESIEQLQLMVKQTEDSLAKAQEQVEAVEAEKKAQFDRYTEEIQRMEGSLLAARQENQILRDSMAASEKQGQVNDIVGSGERGSSDALLQSVLHWLKEAADAAKATAQRARDEERVALELSSNFDRLVQQASTMRMVTTAVVPSFGERWEKSKADEAEEEVDDKKMSPAAGGGGDATTGLNIIGTQVQDALMEVPPTAEKQVLEEEDVEEDVDDLNLLGAEENLLGAEDIVVVEQHNEEERAQGVSEDQQQQNDEEFQTQEKEHSDDQQQQDWNAQAAVVEESDAMDDDEEEEGQDPSVSEEEVRDEGDDFVGADADMVDSDEA